MTGKAITLVFLFALFVGAVATAGSAVHSSYLAAQLDKREQSALAKQQALREQLAQAQSLQPVISYAQDNGYVYSQLSATLQMSVPLAQR